MADDQEKNDEAKKEPKKQEPWWIAFLIGIAMLAGSVFVYFDLTKFELEGGQRRMHWLAVLLYKWLGKWGLVGLMVLIGVALTAYGIVQLCNRLARKEKIEDEQDPRPRRRLPPPDEEDDEPRPRKRPPPVEEVDEEKPRQRRRPRDGDDVSSR